MSKYPVSRANERLGEYNRGPAMKLLYQYLSRHKGALAGALVLTTINQFFSGVLLLLAASVGVAFVSRVAKNFQDYFVSTVTQKMSTTLYAALWREQIAMDEGSNGV